MSAKTIENAYAGFMESLDADAAASGEPMESYFLLKVCEILEEVQGDSGLTDVVPGAYIEKSKAGNNITYINGYHLDDQENILSLFLCDFSTDRESLSRLTKSDCMAQFRRLEKFYFDIQRGKYQHIEPGHPVYGLVQLLRENAKTGGAHFSQRGGRLNLYLLTNKVSEQIPPERKPLDDGFVIEYRVVDFSLINEAKQQPIIVDIPQLKCSQCLQGLDYLRVKSNVDFYEAFLLVIPAEILVMSYDVFRTRLLEQNVRVYLQRKGKINRGIHETIAKEPQAFFIYNNGLALTAERLEFSEDGLKITRLHGLQVVNGGQTMACLHEAWKSKKDISLISVQAKLTIVPGEVAKVIVPYISRYSNCQNAVKNTDQHSNELVQRCIEQHSRKIRTTTGLPTYWYYERMRGQYNNAQLHRSASEVRDFKRKNPKSQLVQPTLLAQAVMTYEMQPYLVARGAQKTYNGTGSMKGFCDYIAKLFAINPGYITDPAWYRSCIAKIILRREAKKTVNEYLKDDYPLYTSFSAAITAYTVSLFVCVMRERNLSLHLQHIWDYQDIDENTRQNIRNVVAVLMGEVSKHPDHSEWLKRTTTWEFLKQFLIDADVALLSNSSLYESKKPDFMLDRLQVWERKEDDELTTAQESVMGVRSDSYWESLNQWLHDNSGRIEVDASTNNVLMKRLKNRKLTDRQSKLLLDCEDRAKKSGWCQPYEPVAKIQYENLVRTMAGNPVNVFLERKDYDVLILDRTCDLMGGSIFLSDLFQTHPDIELDEKLRYGDVKPELGKFSAFETPDHRHIVFIYTRKTKDSPLYLPIIELCLQNVAQEFQQQNLVVSHIGCEGGDSKDLLRRKDVEACIRGELYGHATLIVSI